MSNGAPAMTAPLALTCGDAAGVGPEVIAKWLHAQPSSCGLRIFGPASWLDALPATGFERCEVGRRHDGIEPGKPTLRSASIAVEALEAAAEAVKTGACSGAVTGPISKEWAKKAGFDFPGQTEFFEARWGGQAVMAFGGGRLRVSLATWHIPLSEVPRALNAGNLTRAIRAVAELARAEGIASPRIAVCGLNPHAGEGGLIGSEEQLWIDRLVASLGEELPGLAPTTVPGDTAFARSLRGEFDAVVALYHDQGLAPLKAVDFDDSVNVTLGLPWVRTSPDHGTAFGIAGKGVASHSSWASAVRLAQRLIKQRSGR